MTADLIPAWVDGQLTRVEKLEVHRRGLRHKAVSVFVLRDGKTLLQQRALAKYHTPGLWTNTCCTHPRWDESGADCARRRLCEELGLGTLTPRFAQTVEYRAEVGQGLIEHELVEIFLAEAPPGLEPVPAPSEVMATAWVDLETLTAKIAREPSAYTPWLRIYLERHGAAIFGARMLA